MRAEIYPIENVPCGQLAIMPRPRAGEWLVGEIESWQRSGVNCVVSLLEPAEVTVPDTPEQRTWVTTYCAESAKYGGRPEAL